jgi:hypothetical protein
MRSFDKKINSVIKKGIDPIKMGIFNFKHPDIKTEDLAIERKNTCVGCPLFVNEPIFFFKVSDPRIIELSGKMCDECGCTLSYKLRQSIVKCEKWRR